MDETVLAETHDHEMVRRTVALASDSGRRIQTEIVASLYVEGDRKVVQFNIRDISARSLIDDGLPLTESTAAATGSESAAATETVLLVDNEDASRSTTRRFLEGRGYRVLQAESGPQALEVARAHSGPIDILVTGVVMPKMSGRELAFHLAPHRPEMKVLFTSGNTKEAIVHHGVLEEGVNLLEKPFTQDALVARIRAVLDGDGAIRQPPA